MTVFNDTRVPVTLLTGFLGSGKTTLLNHILHADHGLRVAVLVNDFGAVNIDTQLVVGVEGETISLSNGCICCSIRDDLRQATLDLFTRPEPPEYILIEASGVSDPGAVAMTFFLSPELVKRVRVDGILTVVDAEQVLSLKNGRYTLLAMDQVGVADVVILNKVDLVNEQQLQTVRGWIRKQAAKAHILETSYAQVPLELVLGVGRYEPERLQQRETQEIHVHEQGETHDHEHEHDHEHDHTLVFNTWSFREERPLSYKALRKAVDALPLTIYRAKGILYLADAPDRQGILQVVGKRARVTWGPPWGNATPHTQLVVIGAPDGFDTHQLEHSFKACVVMNGDKPSAVQTVLEWLREKLANQTEKLA